MRGGPAPDLHLPMLSGHGPVRLEDMRGRPVIVTFLRHAG
jgi:peroxiredoxin